ncbi:hypothetical protein B0H13DRAFT_1905917 [Mycena leptocephala]|nr:hypothetical protein B0H13DRAFT_1905917 [Mycena leptocephala]
MTLSRATYHTGKPEGLEKDIPRHSLHWHWVSLILSIELVVIRTRRRIRNVVSMTCTQPPSSTLDHSPLYGTLETSTSCPSLTISSQPGRKRDTSLSPSKGLVAQRRFGARRVAHLQALEQRMAELEEENCLMRQQFNLPPANRPQLCRGPTGREKAKSTSRHSPPKYETLPIGPGRRISPLTVLFQPTSKFASYVTDGVAERPAAEIEDLKS